MQELKWFSELGTIMFDPRIMHEHLFFGTSYLDGSGKFFKEVSDKSSLCAAVWLAFVPDVFREMARSVLFETAKKYAFQKVSKSLKDDIISEFQARVYLAIADGNLTRDGWVK